MLVRSCLKSYVLVFSIMQNQKLLDVQAEFRKGRGTRNQIANICWIIEKLGNPPPLKRKSTSVSSTEPKPLNVGHNSLWKVLKEMGITDHLTCLLRNLYVGQEAKVQTLYGTLIGSRLRKETGLFAVTLFFMLSTSWERLYALQAGIKTVRRNINNLRYADDTTLIAEREEELKNLLMRVKEENERSGLRLNIKTNKQTKIVASSPLTSWQIEGEKVEVVTDFLFLGSKITVDGNCSHEIRGRLLLHREAMKNLECVEKQRHYSAKQVKQV